MLDCSSCGAAAPEGAAYCSSCGARLAAERPASAMRTERKVVTILFADIKGSIDLVAAHDPEQAGDVLDDVVTAMSAAVRSFGGVVNQIMGDGIMALFGAPLAIEEHAALACRAALAMRAAVKQKVHIRVGIGSGEVVVRALSGDMAMHYGAAGEAVHLASRLEQAAGPDQILLTPATLALAAGQAVARSLGPIALKGIEAPMPAFELLAVTERRARTLRRAGVWSRLVGRDAEFAFLQRALDQAASGHSSAVRVVAEAGCGKSRLVDQFTAERLPPEWALAAVEAVPHRRTSYRAVVDLLRATFHLSPEDDPALRREKLLTGLGLPRREAEEQVLPALAGLIGLPPVPGWAEAAPRERRDRTIAAGARAFHQASRHRPLALVIEDAHWLDPESAATLRHLGGGNAGACLLAIATERPPDTPFGEAAHWAECRVDPLDERSTHALLDAMLLPGPDVARLERMLLERTRGNPLFIEECLQALVQIGELQRVGGRYRLDHPIDDLRLPDSLRALLDTRVDRLPTVEKDVLQAAAVVGMSVRSDLLGRVVDVAPAMLDPVLDRLCKAGFLVEAAAPGDDIAAPRRFGFRHGLIRDAAYNGILLKTRIRMHGAVLEALEQRQDDEAADLLADHASRAEAWAKAVRYCKLAASRALDRYANPEALRYTRQALAAAQHWPDGPEKEKTQLGLHIGVRWPLFRLGQVADLLPHLDQAATLAARYDDHVQLGQSHALRSHGFWLAGKPAEAEAAAEAACALALQNDDRDLGIRGQFQRALVHLTSGRASEMVAALEAVVAHIGSPPPLAGKYGLDAELAITSLGYIARAHAACGEFALAHDAVRRATAEARDLDRRQAWIYVHAAHGVVLLTENRPHQAVGQLEAAHSACIETDIRLLQPVAAGFLALAYTESGQATRGAALAQAAVEDAGRMGFLVLQPLRLAILAQARLLCGDLDGADDAATQAAALAGAIREPGAEAFATGLRAEIALRRSDAARAAHLFGAALVQSEALGMAPLATSIRHRIERPDDRAHPWLDGVPLAP